MKHIFSRLISAVLFLLICAHYAWGADQRIVLTQTSLGITATSYASSAGSATVGGVGFAWDKIIKNNSSNMQLQANTGVLYNTTAIPGTIKSIAVTHDETARSSTVYFGDSSQPSGNSSSFSGSATITPTGNYTYFKIQRGANAAYWTQVVVTYTPASSCSNTPTMSFTNTEVNVTTGDASYTQAVNITGKGSGQTVSYFSSDESIGTVNASGVVTLKSKVGTTTITASVSESGTYCSASASYTLNVTLAPIDVILHYKGTSETLNNQPNPCTLPTISPYVDNACEEWAWHCWTNAPYSPSSPTTTAPSSTVITSMSSTGDAYAVYKSGGSGTSTFVAVSQGWSDGENANTKNIDDITYSFAQNSGTNPPRYYDSGTSVRFYQYNSLTIS